MLTFLGYPQQFGSSAIFTAIRRCRFCSSKYSTLISASTHTSRDFLGRADNNNNLPHLPDNVASQQITVLDFRNGLETDMTLGNRNVRSTPENRHSVTR
jgi:hypothetical protein